MTFEIIVIAEIAVLAAMLGVSRSALARARRTSKAIAWERDEYRREVARLEAQHRPRKAANALAFIRDYTFPAQMVERALEHRRLNALQRAEVEEGFRQFLYAAAVAPNFKVGMPSKLVDDLWHEFITYTRDYEAFCQKAYGQFLHHVPEVTMTDAGVQENRTLSMVHTWAGAVRYLGLRPTDVKTTPELFAVDRDTKLAHADKYLPDCGGEQKCDKIGRHVICVEHDLYVPARLTSRDPKPAPAKTRTTKTQPPSSSRSRSSSSSSRPSSTDSGAAILPAVLVAGGSSDDCSSSSSSSSSSYSSCGSSSSSSSSSCGSSCGGGGCGS